MQINFLRIKSNFENSNRWQIRILYNKSLDNAIFKIYFFEEIPPNFLDEKFDLYLIKKENETAEEEKFLYSFYGKSCLQQKVFDIDIDKNKLSLKKVNIYYKFLLRIMSEKSDLICQEKDDKKNLIQTHKSISYIPKELYIFNSETTTTEFKYYFFGNTTCRKFLKNNFDQHILDAYDTLMPGAYKADLFRLCALYILGGIYLDHKNVCNVDLNEIISNEEFLLVNDTHYENINNMIYNGCMVFEKNHSTCEKAIDLMVEKINNREIIQDEPFADLQFGPTFFSKHFKFSEEMKKKKFYFYVPGKIIDNKKEKTLIHTFYSSYKFDATNHYSRMFLRNEIYKK